MATGRQLPLTSHQRQHPRNNLASEHIVLGNPRRHFINSSGNKATSSSTCWTGLISTPLEAHPRAPAPPPHQPPAPKRHHTLAPTTGTTAVHP